MSKDKRKIRTSFRKNRNVRQRDGDLTRRYDRDNSDNLDNDLRSERVSGKGELNRRRTVVGTEVESDGSGLSVSPDVDLSTCRQGRVLSVHGLLSIVAADGGTFFRCMTRRILRTLSTEQRHVVAAGDNVWFRPADQKAAGAASLDDDELPEGMIERVEPRRSVLSRTVRNRQHVIVTNVDQLVIVASAAEPRIKPGLIDRYLVSAEKGHLRPLICINKVDLVDRADLMPLVGVFSRMGYTVVLVSATTGFGIEVLRRELHRHSSVVVGQSGVGKSSLLNAIEPGLGLRVREVSEETQKGKHTTTAAQLLPMAGGKGYVVDTPGVRQFQLWDVIPAEVGGYFRDIRPLINQCRFPNCTHRHETDCAVKDAVADGWLDARRYESYCQLFEGDME